MKKIILILILPLALSLVAIAAQKKEGASATTEQHVVINPADLKWMDAPPGLPPGAKMAVLSGDPGKKGMFTVRLQAPAGYKIPPHSHPKRDTSCSTPISTLPCGAGFAVVRYFSSPFQTP